MLNYRSTTSESGGAQSRGAHRRPPATCSQQSVLRAIDRFVGAVDAMDAAVLVPSRLRDMPAHSPRRHNKPHHQPPPPGVPQDLYSFYGMLKDVKHELLWGPPTTAAAVVDTPAFFTATGMATPRQASDDGLGSSVGCSDTDSDFESIVADRESVIMEQTSHLSTAFRHHLHGLHAILHQLADSADYLSSRYQEEIETPLA